MDTLSVLQEIILDNQETYLFTGTSRHALVTSVTTAINEKKGYLLENLVFCHLRRRSQEIYYYRTKQGNEVDFYWIDHEEKENLVQVSWDLFAGESGEIHIIPAWRYFINSQLSD